MGTTFSTIQIINSKKMSPEKFKESLCKYFAKKGLVIATEDEAQFSYRIAFSDKSNWVTLSLPEYESNMQLVQEDAQGIAKTLKTYCISTSVWDSDMLCLDLFSSEKQRDSVIAGRPLDDDFPGPKGNQKLWQPLLEENATWEQLSEIFSGDYTFIEDALVEMAPLLGMDSGNIARGYDNDSPGSVDLYLKKAQQSGKKAISLNAAFKQIYSEALEPLGFVRIKSKYPYFARLVNNEIVHIITCKDEWSGRIGYKAFDVLGGVATLYRQRINLDLSPRDNTGWLKSNRYLYLVSHPSDFDLDLRNSIFKFYYSEGNVADALEYSLEVTNTIMLPLFEEAGNLESTLMYLRKFGGSLYIYDDKENFGNDNMINEYNEGLLYVKTNYLGDFMEHVESCEAYKAIALHAAECGLPNPRRVEESYDEYYRRSLANTSLRRSDLDNILNNQEKYSKILSELERRKATNTEILKSYGLKI